MIFKSEEKVQLLSLPAEIISLIAQHLYSLSDLFSLLQTCRKLYLLCTDPVTSPSLRPVFPQLHGQHVLPPHPHLLLAGVGRQIADWAIKCDNNRCKLLESLDKGYQGLLELAEQITRLTLNELCSLHAKKADLLYPLAQIVECEVGRRPE